MSAGTGAAGSGGEASKPEVQQGRFWLVWLIPLVAAGYGVYLGIDTYLNEGPTITIYFATADGLEEGKTQIKYRSVNAGVVTSIDIRNESPEVVVVCQLHPKAAPRLKQGSKFWVVRPRLSFGGVSGLGTLVSGAYIAAEFAEEGEPARTFVGLEEPPVTEGEKGLLIKLHARQLGSLLPGAPIYFREIKVGVVGAHSLSDDGKVVEFNGLIVEKHKDLIQDNSRFWNAGGIDVHLGAGTLDVKTESLVTLLAGGVSFDSPPGGKPVEAGHDFLLYESRSDLEQAEVMYGGLSLVLEAASQGSLAEGYPVAYRGTQVGTVVSARLATDSRTVRVKINIYPRYKGLVRENTRFWNASGISADLSLTGLHVHTGSLASLLKGGVALATPTSPGAPAKSGSVFKLHPEVKEDWLEWSPMIWRGPADQKPKAAKPEEHGIASFFHHDGKSEDEAKQDHDPKPADEEKHGFFHRLFD